MIEAHFDSRMNRSTVISGAYQYDTGQRLRLSGLPSADELSQADNMLTGDIPAVQVQFCYAGDSQTEARLAQWDKGRWAWMVDIPDEFLTRHEVVQVFVYVSYGADESGSRSKTMYEGAFTPINRPAPSDTVTDDQLHRWDLIEDEVNLSLANVDNAIANAERAAQTARDIEDELKASADAANDAAAVANKARADLAREMTKLQRLSIRAVEVPPGSDAAVTYENDVITCYIPKGADGAQGPQGETGPSDITLSFVAGSLTITQK